MNRFNTCDRLHEIMATKGLKQVDILNKCKYYCDLYKIKLGRNDLSQYVSGKVIPSQKKLTILALALNVNEAWLMGFDVPMDRDIDTKLILNQSKEFEKIATDWINSTDVSKEEKEKFLEDLMLKIK